MLRLAYRNLFQNRVRLVVSAGGVALALTLILALDAILTGVEEQITAYIDNSGADVFVSQSDVRNMHMASSSIPASVEEEVGSVPGVASVTPILYTTNMIVVDEDRYLAYVIGLPEDAKMGGPWQVPEGRAVPRDGKALIDRSVAEKSDVELGDEVEILGQRLEVVGLSGGTASLANSVAFISRNDFVRAGQNPQTVSFVLAKVEPGRSPGVVASRIEDDVAGVTAQSSQAFADQERAVVKDMSADIVTIMDSIGFMIGLAVVALTVYTATLSRRAEYGVLKALGTRNRHLYGVVLAQALYSVALGFAVGLAFTLLLSAIMPYLGSNLALQISATSLLKVGAASLAIAGLAAIIPVRQIAGLDPATVFRGK